MRSFVSDVEIIKYPSVYSLRLALLRFRRKTRFPNLIKIRPRIEIAKTKVSTKVACPF